MTGGALSEWYRQPAEDTKEGGLYFSAYHLKKNQLFGKRVRVPCLPRL